MARSRPEAVEVVREGKVADEQRRRPAPRGGVAERRRNDAREALAMGLVNAVVPPDRLEEEGAAWGREILRHSPLALRLMKSSFNAELDGMAGVTELAHNATLLFYMSEEGKEGRNAFLEKREPAYADVERFPHRP